MHFFYNLGIRLYVWAIYLASPFNAKAKLWLRGRKNWKSDYSDIGKSLEGCVWFHCASLGEFEMARPLIEKLKKENPQKKILLTFFSPSGFEIRKNYPLADLVLYLPSDTPKNARDFIRIFNPQMAVFVKYEIWLNFLSELKTHKIKTILISAVFYKKQRFFKWYGKIFRDALSGMDKIYVQSKDSFDLLKSRGISSVIAGDTRYDRVFETAQNKTDYPEIKKWCENHMIIIAGSSWPAEEDLLVEYFREKKKNVKLIFAPHDIGTSHLQQLKSKIKIPFTFYSKIEENSSSDILIIDNIGMLSSLYQYGHLAIIGGGFSGKLHNILEAATFGIPILFGPKHQRFQEAREFINNQAAFVFSNEKELAVHLDSLLSSEERRKKYGENSLAIVHKNLGASELIWNESFTSF